MAAGNATPDLLNQPSTTEQHHPIVVGEQLVVKDPNAIAEARKKAKEFVEQDNTQDKREQNIKELSKPPEQAVNPNQAQIPSIVDLTALADGVVPPVDALDHSSVENPDQIINYCRQIRDDNIDNILKANNISKTTFDERAKRLAEKAGTEVTEGIKKLTVYELLRDRALTLTVQDRIDLATKDGLNDNAAKEAVRAEIADQIKAEIKNYKGKPEQLVDQIIKLHQEKNFNNGTLEESDLLVLGIKFEDYNEALVGKDINDDNVRADVVRELFKEKYTEALAKKAVENISEDEVQEDIVDSVTKEKKTINRKLTPEEQEARKVLKREVLENFGKVKDAAKLVEAVNDKRNEVVRAALRLGEAEIVLRLEGREATNGIAGVEGINKRIKDIEDNPAYQAKKSEFDAAQQAKANYIRTARENGLQIEVTQLAELDQRINQASSDIKTAQDELDLLHLEQDILEEAQQVYKDQNSNDPKVKAEAQADIKAAMTEKDGQPYNPGMVDGYNKVRENAVIKLRELQQDIPNVADKLMTAMEDPQKMKEFMAFLNKEKRNKNLRGLGFILAILGYVFAQPFLERMGIK